MILYHGSLEAIEKPNIQYCFKNQMVIDNYLKYTGMEKI